MSKYRASQGHAHCADSLVLQAGSIIDEGHSVDGRGEEPDQTHHGHAEGKDGPIGSAVAARLAAVTGLACGEMDGRVIVAHFHHHTSQ